MSLGHFRLEGIMPAPRGVPQVEVTFDIDANGILNVAARDKATGREQKITITASTNLSKSDIERMVQEARSNDAADRSRRELAEARNTADSLVYQTEKALKELGERAPRSERENIQGKIDALREAMKRDDLAAIQRYSEELQIATHALTQQLYAQQASGNGHKSSPGGRPEEEIVDGEFTQA
jgi:molecular chaperone DnaK